MMMYDRVTTKKGHPFFGQEKVHPQRKSWLRLWTPTWLCGVKILCANVQKVSTSEGLLPPDPLSELCSWTTLGDSRSFDPPVGLSGDVPASVLLCTLTKVFGPDLPLLFKMRQICSVYSQEIIKFVAIRCEILRLKRTKFDFGWAPPETPYSTPPCRLTS